MKKESKNTEIPKIPVVYEHRDFVILEKPPGIGVHKDDKSDGIIPIAQAQLNLEALWLVHRLDKVTSGCLILAKSQAAASEFGNLFEQKQVTKHYLAITDKKPKKRQGSVIGDLKKVRDGKWMLTRSRHNPSVTHFYDKGIGNGLRAQILKLYTGQTHQLRVVLNSLGATILGDHRYSGTKSDRTYLHSWHISFDWNNEKIDVQAVPSFGQEFTSQEFQTLLNNISPPGESFTWPDEKLIKIARNADA